MTGQHTGGTNVVSISDEDIINVAVSDDDIVNVVVNSGDITVEAGEVVASDPDVDAARLGNGI